MYSYINFFSVLTLSVSGFKTNSEVGNLILGFNLSKKLFFLGLFSSTGISFLAFFSITSFKLLPVFKLVSKLELSSSRISTFPSLFISIPLLSR